MQPPRFWQNPRAHPGIYAGLLKPFSKIWEWQTARRIAQGTPTDIGIPVICVGNLNVGGTGKTPTVCAILQRLAEQGVTGHALSRGYGGQLAGPLRVDPQQHSAADVGDEPLLLSAFAPTWIAKNRAEGGILAAKSGAGAVVMDDGFQNPSLKKSVSILVIDAESGFGNGHVLPAGPLREPMQTGLARADLVLSIGPDQAQARLDKTWPELSAVPRARGILKPLETGMDWQGQRVLAFAGIGRPGKFFATLAGLGADIVASHSFPDHAEYPRALISRLSTEAKAKGLQMVTTEKDSVRLPPDFRRNVIAVPVRLELQDWGPLDAALKSAFQSSV